MADRIIILGTSARAAAFSALRAGFAPWTADLFADADLAARCPARRVEHYPRNLEGAAREAPPGPWMYTGALENHPGLVDRIAAERTLWGNAGEVLRKVRDPWKVREALLAEGLPSPVLEHDRANLRPGVWLRKPRRSAGGAHLQRVEITTAENAAAYGQSGSGVYWQEFIPGVSVSAVFVAARCKAVLLGATRQLIGKSWTGARGFQYAGSIGPLRLRNAERKAWDRIGNCLARRFELVGLFGVDAIRSAGGMIPVEVNPRYPASMEVLEQSLGFSAIAYHAAACRDQRLPEEPTGRCAHFCGKAILYARRSGPAGEAFWRFVHDSSDNSLWPLAADLPHEGEIFQAGRPIMTLLAYGASEDAVRRELERRSRQAFSLLEASWL